MKTNKISGRTQFKRLISVLLCCIMCFGMFPTAAFAADTTVDVTTQKDITDALNAAQDGDKITFVLQNDIELGANGEALITVKNGVTAVLTNKEGVTVKVSRILAENSCFNVNGELAINENTSGGGSLSFDGWVELFPGFGSSIDFKEYSFFNVNGAESSLTVNGGTFTRNTSTYGAIYSHGGANVAINSGTFTDNSSAANGGAICALGSTLTINGGIFTGNTAGTDGGAVYYNGLTAENKLSVAGGTFSGNAANGFGGGALFIDCTDPAIQTSLAEISGGKFTANTTEGFGGAIYIQVGAAVKLQKAYMYQNTASTVGGGIWNCPTGGGDYYTFYGMYLANNAAKKGADFFSETGPSGEKPNVYLTDYAFTGDKINWIYDTGDEKQGTPAPNEYYQNSTQNIELKSGLTEKESLSGSAVVFAKNSAGAGGAIANNGHLQIGEETRVSVQKQTTTTTSDSFTFSLSVARDNAGFPGSFVYRDESSGALGCIAFDENGMGSIALKSGQTFTILDLPVNMHLEIAETSLPNGWALKSSTNSSIDILDSETTVPAITAVFTNELQTGNLAVSKTVSGSGASTTQEFEFTVTLGDTTISGTYGDMSFTNGVATFKLKDGESKTAKGLPTDTTYTVVENNNDGYTVTKTNDTGTIVSDTTEIVTFNNHKDSGDVSDKITVSVQKIWQDADSASRPSSVSMQLYKDGKAFGSPLTLNAANGWKAEWAVDNNATWTVDEVNVPSGYIKSVSNTDHSWTITNKLNTTTPSDPDSPQTGDTSNMTLWVSLLFLSGGALAVLGFYKKRRHISER